MGSRGMGPRPSPTRSATRASPSGRGRLETYTPHPSAVTKTHPTARPGVRTARDQGRREISVRKTTARPLQRSCASYASVREGLRQVPTPALACLSPILSLGRRRRAIAGISAPLERLGRVRVRDPLGSPVLIYYLYSNDLLASGLWRTSGSRCSSSGRTCRERRGKAHGHTLWQQITGSGHAPAGGCRPLGGPTGRRRRRRRCRRSGRARQLHRRGEPRRREPRQPARPPMLPPTAEDPSTIWAGDFCCAGS